MHRSGARTVLSPSDLVAHLGCEHATELERRVLLGELEPPAHHDPGLEVLRRRGGQHELAELARFRARGCTVATVQATGSSPEALAAAEAETLAHMRAGADVVYQATFFDGRWRGHADFLLRRHAPSHLGPWSYDVADTKLARRAKPAALIQLCAYAEQVARLQGTWPEELVVITGDGEWHRHRSGDVAAYHRAAKRRFEAVVDGPPRQTEALPVRHCEVCAWAPRCEAGWRAADHLTLVAGVRASTAATLSAAGITTGALLAASPDGAALGGVPPEVGDRLRRQARLQLAQRADGIVRHELLVPEAVVPAAEEAPPDPRRGLAALPAPSPGDLFFDIEGDPWVGADGREYLFGVVEAAGPSGAPPPYTGFWGHDAAGEKRAFEQLVDLVVDRLDRFPDMHVYHYAAYERTVLQRLAGRHDTRAAEVDRILRGQVLVDLYQVVRSAVLVSQEGYGLKKLEPLYLPASTRGDDAVTDGGSSIVVYEEWLDTGDQRLLEDIRAYNEVDCRSTLGLRDWLEERRLELAARTGSAPPRPAPAESRPSDGVAELDERQASVAGALLDGLPEDRAALDADGRARRLLADLLGWHRREDRPAWWAWFARRAMTDLELVEDREAVGVLVPLGAADPADPGLHRYAFDPDQEHRLPLGKPVADPRTGGAAGTLVAVDAAAGWLELRRSPRSRAPHPTALVPPAPFAATEQQEALLALARHVASEGLDGGGPWRAARDLLARRPPRRAGASGGPLQRPGEGSGDALVRLVGELDATTLAVQGPPGSGKTHHGARAVVGLVAAGRRVGITAPSHAAVANLLDAVCAEAARTGTALRAVQKCDVGQRCASADVARAASNAEVVAALADGVDVVAGTAWLFSRTELRDALDVVFVDEAGQLSLADTLAVSGAATSLVLLGDPQQLAQPSKGTHPDGAGASGLDHVLAGRSTLPAEHGLFLDRSHRMHPAICRFVSALAYDDRLHAGAGCERRAAADGPLVGGSGLRWLPVTHAGNRTRAAEEVTAVAALVAALVGRAVTDEHGREASLGLADVLVIAPYNAQVAALAAALPEGARVGTVDRFQGQQAPVVLYSLAASSAAEVPRGIEFLLSTHRLNVAVSRAQALAVVVGSPALLQAPVRTTQQLRQVNALCRLVEEAELVHLATDPAPLAVGARP